MFAIRNRFTTRKSASAARRDRLRARPTVQALEDRTLLSFNAPINLPTGHSPEGIAVADLTGNGIRDLVVTNKGFSDGTFRGVSILLGNGDGTFQPARNIDVGPQPFAVAVGDFDGDGTPDLAVTHANDLPSDLNTVSILLGNGDGTFRAGGELQVGMNPRSVAVGDFNADGKLDLVTANASSNTVSVLLGNGDGTFQTAVALPVASDPVSVAVGDFSGNLGIVTANDPIGDNGSLSLLLGNGDGTFQGAITLGLGNAGSRPAPRTVAVADLIGNGIPDLVTANDADDGGTVSVLLGNGNGIFRDAVTFPVVQAPFSNPLSLAVGDFHGNGRPDLIVGNVSFGSGRGNLDQLFLLAGNGDGSFQAPVAIDSGMQPIAMAVGHFTSDGALDLAVANVGGGDASVLLGRGDGTFNGAPDFAAGPGVRSLAQGDFNGDGILDLVTANSNDDSISVLLGNGDGTFQAPVTYAVGHLPGFVAVADLTGNGIQDIVVANGGSAQGTLSVLLGNGDGTFQPAITINTGLPVFVPISVVVAEFNSDGIPDLAISYEAGAGTAAILVLAGNGDGTFRQLNNLVFNNLSIPGRLAVADVNGDGTADIVLPVDGVNGGGVEVLLGDGQGGFRDLGLTRTGVEASAVAVGDFNGDGFLDLAVTNFLSNTVSVLLGNGSGIFQAPVNYTVGGNPRSVVVADLEGDGILDIATANSTGNTVSFLRGKGDGTFQTEIRYLTGSGTNAVVAGDFNGDGALDLATANGVSGNVSVLVNRNDGTGPHRRVAARHIRPNGSSAGLAQAEHVAAVDALFTGVRAESLRSVVIGQQPPVAANVGAFSASRSEALTAPKAQQTVVDADTRLQQHQRERIAAFYAAGLADPLLETL